MFHVEHGSQQEPRTEPLIKAFSMMQPGIEPRSPGLLANTVPRNNEPVVQG